MWFACQVHLKLQNESKSVTCAQIVHTWQKMSLSCGLDGEPCRFYHGEAKPQVSLSQLLLLRNPTAPCETTLYIYTDICRVKKGR